MSNHDILTDDYVAELLAKDAKESSIKYSTIGLEAFSSSSKPPIGKPKPNTRFLRNIIKETDNHNAALLAREAAEAQARLRTLPRNDAPRIRVAGGDIRRRQLGDIAAILGGRSVKRRRTEEQDTKDGRHRRSTKEEEKQTKMANRSSRRHIAAEKEGKEIRGSRSHRDPPLGQNEAVDLAKQIESRRRNYRSRSRSPRDRDGRHSREGQRSSKDRRSASPEGERKYHRSHRSRQRRYSSSEREPETHKSRRRVPGISSPPAHYDSDPLDDIIGPRPPSTPEVRTRGRGTTSQASGIESRFSAKYDPSADVQLDPDEEDDWGDALEALRDRQKYKQSQADRMRAAGFTEEEVSKWKTGTEKREEDVTWSKKGEGREWDRGKVIDHVGDIGHESSFLGFKDN